MHRCALPVLLAVSCTAAFAQQTRPVPTTQPTESAELLKSDSRAPYVHRLSLYDHAGRIIDPNDRNAVPYSSAMTCAKCHPYATIAHGWHFNAWDPNVPAGRAGEPWLLSDARTGTVLPISGRGWPGTFKPQDVGLSNWEFVLRFGHHTPGGGYGERGGPTPGGQASEPGAKPTTAAAKQPPKAPADDIDLSDVDPAVMEKKAARGAEQKTSGGPQLEGRWAISGRLEVDCMFCHSADQSHDPAEAARQIEAQNFKWAPTVALGLGVVRGEVRKLPDDFDPEEPPNPDYPQRVPPKLVWDKRKFDADNRVFFNITRRPPADRCYFCHSFREVGPNKTDDLLASRDVHLAAGMTCVDCHRNELDHQITRGFDTEAGLRGDAARFALSCEGCHLGTAREYAADDTLTQPLPLRGRGVAEPTTQPDEPVLAFGGRYGAPRPQHRGIPPLHFEKLTCTACHSGPWPEMQPKQMQTALAHALGIASRERKDTDLPVILEPIFARQDDGKIAPQRMVWGAFWAGTVNGLDRLLSPEQVIKLAGTALGPVGQPLDASNERIAAILQSLAKGGVDHPFYVHSGGDWSYFNDKGTFVPSRLDESDISQYDQAWRARNGTYRWSIAHDVRPASQALGVRGCTDCHATDAPFYFAAIGDGGEWQPQHVKTMAELRGDDVSMARAWGFGYEMRPAFKGFALVCTALLALVLARGALDLLGGEWRWLVLFRLNPPPAPPRKGGELRRRRLLLLPTFYLPMFPPSHLPTPRSHAT